MENDNKKIQYILKFLFLLSAGMVTWLMELCDVTWNQNSYNFA